MNREQRRSYKKYLDSHFRDMSEETKQFLIQRYEIMTSSKPVMLYEGDTVILNFDRITNYPDYKRMRQEYRDFIESNATTEFTVEYDTYRKEKSSRDKHFLVQLKEDVSDPKFLFHAVDLIVVKRKRQEETQLEAHIKEIEEAMKGMK